MSSDSKHGINAAYIGAAVLACLMLVEYIGVVAPAVIPSNPLLDPVTDIVVLYHISIRWLFILVSIVGALISPASDMVGDDLSKTKRDKTFWLVVFIGSTLGLALVHRFPLIAFIVGYPVLFLIFNFSAFILINLLKRKRKKIVDNFGFRKAEVKVENEYSIHWYSPTDGYINVENPFRGIYVQGGAGAGKSYTIIEHIIDTLIEKMFTGLVYDFKFPTLSKVVYKTMVNKGSIPAKKDTNGNWIGEPSLKNDRRKIWNIYFKDVRYSHRINPIDPEYMETPAFADMYAMTLLTNLEPKWIKERDFFSNSAIIYLKAIMWFLRVESPTNCTLPHAIRIATMDYEKVIAALRLNPEAAMMISSLSTADRKNAEGQISGVVASLQVPIDRLNSPEVYWVLSKSDFSLKLNDPKTPGILCLGNDPLLASVYGPLGALIATVTKGLINREGKLPSFFIVDEFPTIYLPDIDQLPATGRSNKVVSVFCAQDISQLVAMYQKDRADVIVANMGNQFSGQLNDLNTQKYVSEMIGQRDKENVSVNTGKSMGESLSKSTGENVGIQKEALIHPYQIGSLEVGRFVGKVATVTGDYDYFFNVKPDVVKNETPHDYNMVLVNEDGSEISPEKMTEILKRNYDNINEDARVLIDVCAKLSCKKGLSSEEKVFPHHFYKNRRVLTTDGEIADGVSGIRVNPKNGLWEGTPVFDVDADSAA